MKCGIRISDCGVKTRKTMDDGKEKLIAEFGLRLREPSGSERMRDADLKFEIKNLKGAYLL